MDAQKTMDNKTMVEQADLLIAMLRGVKSEEKKKEKLSLKSSTMDYQEQTQKQMQKVSTDLNWQCMYLDRIITDFARVFSVSKFNVDTGKKKYNPSSFHSYKG